MGEIKLFKTSKSNQSYCWQDNMNYNYQGIEKALCGKTSFYENGKLTGERFTPKRIFIIQMK